MTIDSIVALFAAKRVGASWVAFCPAHHDRTPSLGISEGSDGRILVKCRAGCATVDVLAAKGLRLADLFLDPTGQGVPLTLVHSNTRTVGLTLEEYSAAKQLPVVFLQALGLSTIASTGIKAVRIPYFDIGGREVAAQLRLALSGPDRFRWTKGSKPQPYGQQRVAEARSVGHITIVEGPSDSQTLWHHGIPALGLPSASMWKSEWETLLDGIETVYVVVEPDAGGRAVLGLLSSVGFRRRVKLLRLGGAKDPSELFLKTGEAFVAHWNEAVRQAQPWVDAIDDDRIRRSTEAYDLSEKLLKSVDLLDQIRGAIRAGGYAGDLNVPMLVYVGLTTRLLERPLNLAVIAPSGAGKNHAVDAARALVPAESTHLISASSERALIYSDQSFSHRIIVFAEADSIPEDGPAASAIRSIVTDGRMVYEVVERNPKTGKHETRKIEKDGPTGLITTSTRSLSHQMSTRVLEVTLSDDPEQTKQIMLAQARRVQPTQVIAPDRTAFIALQRWLESGGEHRVAVPFADTLARLVPAGAVRMRRDFPQLLATVQGIACLMQQQRTRTREGWIEATLEDYAVARELLAATFDVVVAESVSSAVRQTVDAIAPNEEVSMPELADRLRLAKSSVSYRVNRAVAGGYLVKDEKRPGHAARVRRGDPLPDLITALPTVEEIRGVFESSNPRREIPPPTVARDLSEHPEGQNV